MRHLHTCVMNKQVLYLGVSDTPAWVVVKANDCKLANHANVHHLSVRIPVTKFLEDSCPQ
jgi:hypothetical protein